MTGVVTWSWYADDDNDDNDNDDDDDNDDNDNDNDDDDDDACTALHPVQWPGKIRSGWNFLNPDTV